MKKSPIGAIFNIKRAIILFIMGTTSRQKEFIESNDKYIRLLAPAGCGKTYSIIKKAKRIIELKPQSKIKIFTFTKFAGSEIKSRLKDVKDSENISVATLNSWGNTYVGQSVLKNAKLVEKHEDRKYLMLNSLQPVWRKNEHQRIASILSGKNKIKNSEKLLEYIDNFKNLGLSHSQVKKNFNEDEQFLRQWADGLVAEGLARYLFELYEELIKALGYKSDTENISEWLNFAVEKIARVWLPFYKDCCNYMLASGLYTFEDQKYFSDYELKKRLARGEKWTGSARTEYVFIDEFQDTSPLDIDLIKNFQKINDSSLFIVGDDDQAIFEFRGSTPYFILHPEEMFSVEHFTTFILNENFRSPHNIVEDSMKLIKNNKNRVDKSVIPTVISDATISVIEPSNNHEMIEQIIEKV
jgi:DNA helicase-2/ATP-dependent DNA helicase PcrA